MNVLVIWSSSYRAVSKFISSRNLTGIVVFVLFCLVCVVCVWGGGVDKEGGAVWMCVCVWGGGR